MVGFFFFFLHLNFFILKPNTVICSFPQEVCPLSVSNTNSHSRCDWPSLRKHSHIMHSVMKPASFMHTHYSSYEPCVFPAFSGDRENKTRKTEKQPFLKVENIQGTFSLIICCLLLLFNITHIPVFCTCVTVHSS